MKWKNPSHPHCLVQLGWSYFCHCHWEPWQPPTPCPYTDSSDKPSNLCFLPRCDCSTVLYITLTAQHPTVTQGYTNNNEPAKNFSSPEHARRVHWLPGSCRTSRWLQGGLVLPTCYWGSPPPLGSSLFWCYTPPASRLSQHLPSAGLSAYCFPCSVEQRHRISIISSCTWNICHICGRTWIQRAKTIKVQALWFTNNSSSSIFFY